MSCDSVVRSVDTGVKDQGQYILFTPSESYSEYPTSERFSTVMPVVNIMICNST